MSAIITKNKKETQTVARILAQETCFIQSRRAVVLGLIGELGTGKTAFVQGFARALGIKERVLSPTFVLMKVYRIPSKLKVQSVPFKHLAHLDCYRITSGRDLIRLGLKDILEDPRMIVLIEWADRIAKKMPPDTIWLQFYHGARVDERTISVSYDDKKIKNLYY